jgi:hypothetical protein
MAGRPESRRWRSATGPQLWRLNRLGRLKIVDDAVCISSAEASSVLDVEVGKLKAERFPDTRTARRLAELKDDSEPVASGQATLPPWALRRYSPVCIFFTSVSTLTGSIGVKRGSGWGAHSTTICPAHTALRSA